MTNVEPLTQRNYDHARMVHNWRASVKAFNDAEGRLLQIDIHDQSQVEEQKALLSLVARAAVLTRNMMLFNANNLDPLSHGEVMHQLGAMSAFARVAFDGLMLDDKVHSDAGSAPCQMLVPAAARAYAECIMTLHHIQGHAAHLMDASQARDALDKMLGGLERSTNISQIKNFAVPELARAAHAASSQALEAYRLMGGMRIAESQPKPSTSAGAALKRYVAG